MNIDKSNISFTRPKIVSLIGIIQIIFAVNFITITIYSAYQDLGNYDTVKNSNKCLEKKIIEKNYLEYRKSIILRTVLPALIAIITIIVASAFLKGYQWGRIVLSIFMVTAIFDGFIGIVVNEAPILSGFKLTIQGIIFLILIFNRRVKFYFKWKVKQRRMLKQIRKKIAIK